MGIRYLWEPLAIQMLVMVPSTFALDPPLFDLMECLVDHGTLSTCDHVGHHVDLFKCL